MKPIYVDHGATTPLLKEALEEGMPYLDRSFANPSSMHPFGIEVRKRINIERENLAKSLKVSPKELYFTSGATEAINLVLQGVSKCVGHDKEILTTKIEHKATLNTLHTLEKEGVVVRYIPVDSQGLFDFDLFEEMLTPKVGLVSLMWANNEIGTLYDMERIASICQKKNVLLHVDAVCVATKIEMDLSKIPIDYLSISAHKFYGPKGIGLLFVRDNAPICPLIFGGSHENHLRAGTENVFGIVALSKAFGIMSEKRKEVIAHLNELTTAFREKLSQIDGVYFNGPTELSNQLPGLVSVRIKGFQSIALGFELARHGIYASSGSACNSDVIEESHVIQVVNRDCLEDFGVVRFTFGKDNRLEEVNRIVVVIKEIIVENN
ncbi:Cysteine desulfurase [Paracholeplasma brassicae]|jgi:cysteine desulfurase|uniref:cysteine desulfurase n=1 Tax=Acholeplasma brassicae TaxID=61635 RepID=U4KQV7_9MOLU|nr:cysteine desulfurase family protein [Paracholeplasma brassicae]CCV65193.1 Cysteine desulfurase [Paracholeplasma brassicae]